MLRKGMREIGKMAAAVIITLALFVCVPACQYTAEVVYSHPQRGTSRLSYDTSLVPKMEWANGGPVIPDGNAPTSQPAPVPGRK